MTEKNFAPFQDAAVDDAVLRKKEQKDVELDKKILALRKKNEALIRRYQVSLHMAEGSPLARLGYSPACAQGYLALGAL